MQKNLSFQKIDQWLTGGWEGTIKRQEEEMTKESEETFACVGHFHYLDYVNSFMGVKTYQTVHSKHALLVLY